MTLKLMEDSRLSDFIEAAASFDVVETGESGFVAYLFPKWERFVVPHQSEQFEA